MTDMLQIKTVLGRKLIASLLKKFIESKTGYKMGICIDNLIVENDSETGATISLNAAITVDKDTFKDICGNIYGR